MDDFLKNNVLDSNSEIEPVKGQIIDSYVLLIDSNPTFLDLLKMQFNSSGVLLDCATSISNARIFFQKKYNVVAVNYDLGSGVTGIDIIKMYKVRYPYTRTILYSKNIAKLEADGSEIVDKIFQFQEVNELVSCIKTYCIKEIEPQIIEAIFCELNRLKSKMATMQDSIETIDLKQTVETLHNKVNNFIVGHKNDAYKIISVFVILEILHFLLHFFHKF